MAPRRKKIRIPSEKAVPEIIERFVKEKGEKKGLVATTRYENQVFADFIRQAAALEGLSISTLQRKALIEYLRRTHDEDEVNAIVEAAEEKQTKLRRRPRKKGLLAQIRAMRRS